VKFKCHNRESKSFLLDHIFYSVKEFLCYWFDAVTAWIKWWWWWWWWLWWWCWWWWW